MSYSGLICICCVRELKCTPKTTVSTWHNGHCDYCDEDANVTESRDYGWPDRKVDNENTKTD